MEKPLVSLCIYTYKQEHLVRETLEAAVAQDYPNLEIIVSDDCSPDNTFGVIQDFAANYKGSHKLIINRNEPNLGIAGNVMKLFSLSHGKYIVNNCGDDLSVPTRCSKSVEAIEKAGVESMSFAMETIDAEGLKTGKYGNIEADVKKYTIEDYILGNVISSGASRIMTRRIVEEFGELLPGCPTEDSTFTFRAFLLGGTAFSSEPLVLYRVHGENTSIGLNYLKRIKPQPIYDQYMRDLNIAVEKNLINIEQEQSLRQKFDAYLKKELAIRELFFCKSFLSRASVIFRQLFCRSYPINLKRNLGVQFIRWTVKKVYEC